MDSKPVLDLPTSDDVNGVPPPAPGWAGSFGVVDGRTVADSIAPRWSDNGEPITLSAAACDALDWLEWMRGYLTANKTTRLDQTRANLARCAIMLRAKIEQTITGEEGLTTRKSPEQSGDAAEGVSRQDGSSSPNTPDHARHS